MRVINWGVFAALALSSSAALSDEPAVDVSTADSTCELHVSGGGYPERLRAPPKNSMFVRIEGWAPPDFDDPLSRVNIFSASRRAVDLPDEALRRLLPDYDTVEIIRHPELVDMDQINVKRTRERLFPSQSECYADLIITDFTAMWPNPDAAYQQYGLIGAAIVGGNRTVASYLMLVHETRGERPQRIKKRMDAPLGSPPSDIENDPARMIESLNSSNAEILNQFIEVVARKRKR